MRTDNTLGGVLPDAVLPIAQQLDSPGTFLGSYDSITVSATVLSVFVSVSAPLQEG